MAIEVFSFFSGLGFMDLGFEEAGFDIAFVNEYNHSFIQAYQYARRNRPHRPQYGYYEGSIEEFLDDRVWNQRFPDYDVRNKDRIIGFIGGPPCPDFSTAGKNAGSTGENGKLTEKYVKLIVKRQPDFFVLENVKGLYQTKKHKIFYEQMKKRLYRAGYSLFDSIENEQALVKTNFIGAQTIDVNRFGQRKNDQQCTNSLRDYCGKSSPFYTKL